MRSKKLTGLMFAGAGATLLIGPTNAAAQDKQVGELSVPGGMVHYEVAGSGPAFVLIHGGMMDLRMWEPQFEAFAARGRVLRYDIRGMGASPASTTPFNVSDDLVALLDHLNIDRATIVGLSIGGAIAIDFALTFPERVRRLVLAEPGIAGHTFSPDVMQRMMAVGTALQQNDTSAAMATFLESPALAHAAMSPQVRRTLEDMISENLDGLFAMQMMRMHEANAMARLTELTMPTLILISEHATPDAVAIHERLVADVPNKEVFTIDGAGHMMNIEQPDRFNRIVLAFASRHQ